MLAVAMPTSARPRQLGRVLQLPIGRHRPDDDAVAADRDAREPADSAQVHQRTRSREPHLHRRQQRVPARQHLGIGIGREERTASCTLPGR